MTDTPNQSIPKVPAEGNLVDWVKPITETVSTRDVVNDVYRIDTYISLAADKITKAQEKLFRDWLISQGWTPPKEDHEV